jgi:hypothetical protein
LTAVQEDSLDAGTGESAFQAAQTVPASLGIGKRRDSERKRLWNASHFAQSVIRRAQRPIVKVTRSWVSADLAR